MATNKQVDLGYAHYHLNTGENNNGDFHEIGQSSGFIHSVVTENDHQYTINNNHTETKQHVVSELNGVVITYDSHYSSNQTGYNEVIHTDVNGVDSFVHINTHGPSDYFF